MCVRALRITVLKSAGNFTRDECHDLNAEKIQRVKCFMLMRYGICCAWQFSNTGAAGWVRKFQAMVNWRKWRFTSPCPVYLRKQTSIGRVGMSALCRYCSLIPGLAVKLSTIILAGPTVLSAVGVNPPHDGVR
jgi:hypothetical protein